MHKLNGAVSTPIFDHLGSSAWHSFDGRFIIMLRSALPWILPVLLLTIVGSVLIAKRRRLLVLRRPLPPNMYHKGRSYTEGSSVSSSRRSSGSSSGSEDLDDEKSFRDVPSRSSSFTFTFDDGSV